MASKAEKLAREARIACEKWRQYFKYNIDQYHKMMGFVLGRQWTEDEEDMLKKYKKVPLQFNKLATLVNSLLGEQQQNTPQLEVVPLSNCDEETASLRSMVVKDIMLGEDAKTVYQVAAFQSFVGGFGAFLWDTDYASSRSFDQDMIPRHFKDASRSYWDLGADRVDKTDGMVCGYVARMTRPKFREVYGKDIEEKILNDVGVSASKEEIALATDPALKNDSFSWADDEGITINHFYKRKFVKDMLYKLSNGKTLNQEEMDELIKKSRETTARLLEQQMMMGEYSGLEMGRHPMDMETPPPLQPPMMGHPQQAPIGMEPKAWPELSQVNDEFITLYDDNEAVRIEGKREIRRSKIMHYEIAGDYELDKSECPCEDLPLVFMDQNSYYDKDGKQICRPFIIDAVDAQRYINYLGTQSAFILKISRYDQFIASKKNVQGSDTERTWRDPYTVQGALIYDESPSGAKPEQLRPPELSVSLSQQYERAIQDLYTSTGLYPTQLGQQGNEISGAAIDARTRQGSYSTYVAFNSVNRAISAGGRIVNQMVPRVYDTERVINLMTPDEGRKNITINQQMDDYAARIKNDIRKGSFEVRLQAGPSYEGQKAQALESLNMVLQANPQLLNLFADLYAENLPLVNTIEIKNRLKTIVPPAIIEAGKTGKMPQENGQSQPSPEEQALEADIQYKKQQIEIKKQELIIKQQEAEAKIEIERIKLEIAQMELAGNIEEQKLRYIAETERTNSDQAIAHADNLVKILTHKQSL